MPDITTKHHAEVLVLGAGIVGVTLALKLQEQGCEVLLTDRADAGAATSFGNAGLIERSSVFPYAFPRDWKTLLAYALQKKPASYYHPSALPSLFPWLLSYWRHSSAALYPAAISGALPLIEHSWSEHAPLIGAAGASALVNEHGWIKVWRSTESEHASLLQAEQTRDYGLDVRVLSKAALLAHEPGLSDELRGGVHYPESRQIQDPQALTRAYLDLFVQRGGVFVQGDARSLQSSGTGWRIDTRAGPRHAPNVVLALGPWGEDHAQAQIGRAHV